MHCHWPLRSKEQRFCSFLKRSSDGSKDQGTARGVVSVPLIIDDDHEIVEHLESMVRVCITPAVTILTRPEIYFSLIKAFSRFAGAGRFGTVRDVALEIALEKSG